VLLVDASVWVAAVVPANRDHMASKNLLRSSPEPLWMLDLTLYEVANAVAVKYRRPDEARNLARVMRRRSGNRTIKLDLELFDAAVSTAAEHDLTAYDAAYVAAARRNRMTLVSIDVRDLVSKGLAVTPDAAV
jgi:predicted nucleic acid-binding protein